MSNLFKQFLNRFSFLHKFKFIWISAGVAGLFLILGIIGDHAQYNTFAQPIPVPPPENSTPLETEPTNSFNLGNTTVCAPDSLLKKQISNWAKPTKTKLTKNIIIAAGHNGFNDVHKPGLSAGSIPYDGTNGVQDTPVYYEGKERSLEGAVNLMTVSIIKELLEDNDFNVNIVYANPGENLRSKMERIKKMIKDTDTFAFEVHFDDPNGKSKPGGAGVIPPNIDPYITVNSDYVDVATPIRLTQKGIHAYDIALAQEFGAYPQDWRDGLGGPRRGVTLLEIDRIKKIEPLFREALKTGDDRDVSRAKELLTQYSNKIVNALTTAYNIARNPNSRESFTVCSTNTMN